MIHSQQGLMAHIVLLFISRQSTITELSGIHSQLDLIAHIVLLFITSQANITLLAQYGEQLNLKLKQSNKLEVHIETLL